jgi:hypothetical protein
MGEIRFPGAAVSFSPFPPMADSANSLPIGSYFLDVEEPVGHLRTALQAFRSAVCLRVKERLQGF